MQGCAYVNGQFAPPEEAKISVFDWGFLHSDATYDVAHVWQGRFFRLDAHLDRFFASCDALRLNPGHSRDEIRQIEQGELDRQDNPLKNAPHTAAAVTAADWPHSYSRERAAFPTAATRSHKFWPAVARVDNAYGDRHLVCACPPIEAYAEK